jgi:LPXTG-site transpeptidase (sortase) family protein
MARWLLRLTGLGLVVGGGIGLGLLLMPGTVPALRSGPLASANDTPSVPAAPVEQPAAAAVSRLLVPRLEIEAAVVRLGMQRGVMESPAQPEVVGWYSFTAPPGKQGNAVFAGHLNFAGRGVAVFRDLGEAALGDEIVVELVDGRRLEYRVVAIDSYTAWSAPVTTIVGPSEGEVVTLITCAGAFDAATGQYEKRLVVTAERWT